MPKTQNYFGFFFVSGICAVLFLGMLVVSAHLYFDIISMRSELRSDMDDFSTLTDEIWHNLLKMRPTFQETFLIGTRIKRQYQSEPVSKSQTCICGKTSNNCPAGPPGPPGNVGETGLPGGPGRPGQPGLPGEEMVYENVKPPCIKCPMGPPGPPGDRGHRGRRGEDGHDGEDGVNGRDGEDGNPGCIGDNGPKGPRGSYGDPGPDGEVGIYGKGKPGPKGPIGDPGPAGPPGTHGFPGHPGPVGPIGNPGAQGQPGLDGEPGQPGGPGPSGEDAKDATYCECPARFTQNPNAPIKVNPSVIIREDNYRKYKHRKIVASAVKIKPSA